MKDLFTVLAVIALLCAGQAGANGILSGTPKLACEATLCLAASGGTPGECIPSLETYFSIEIYDDGDYKPRATLNARKAFLQNCPGADSASVNRVNTSKQAIQRCIGRQGCRDSDRGLVERL